MARLMAKGVMPVMVAVPKGREPGAKMQAAVGLSPKSPNPYRIKESAWLLYSV